MAKRKRGATDVPAPAPAAPTVSWVSIWPPGSGCTTPPPTSVAPLLNGVSVTGPGCGYTTVPPAERRRARGRPPRLPPTEVFGLPDSLFGPEAAERCDTCGEDIPFAGAVNRDARQGRPFRLAIVCLACYEQFAAEVGDTTVPPGGAARGLRATWVTAAKYQAFRQYQAAKLGLVARKGPAASAGPQAPE
jgi:hypothetical protein